MQIASLSELRKNMKHLMDRTQERHEPLIITRKNSHMIMMSLEDYNSFEETLYILNSPKNAQRIFSSIEQLRMGKGRVHQLVED